MPGRLLPFLFILLLISCQKSSEKSQDTQQNPQTQLEVPPFNADSAYNFVEKQVAFGPRVPGTTAHAQTAQYLVDRLTAFGADVTVQEFDQTTFDNNRVTLKNIIATFYPDKKKRILLAAHWDTRPFADEDEDNPNRPMDGANDGGSGVAVLLEIARSLNQAENPPGVGIDLILFDGEDWGERGQRTPLPPGLDSWWCLGSQYWSAHKHKPGYSAYYGILLDMVGAKGSQFFREELSVRYAPSVVERVWTTASQLGHGRYFVNKIQPEVLDDHKFITEKGRIPTIDIINYDPVKGSFGDFWHTQQDNMDIISKETLKAVGETVLHQVYSEEPGA